MKKVIFLVYSLGIGGVEKALLGVIDEFINNGYEVHIALMRKEGPLLEYLPTCVKLHQVIGYEEVLNLLHNPLRPLIKASFLKFKFKLCLILFKCYLSQKFKKSSVSLYKYGFKAIPKCIHEQFDLAVAFAGPDSFIDYYVDQRISSKDKWGWIHFDITKFGCDEGITKYVYRHFSQINIVSKEAKEKFDYKFPEFSSKTLYKPNRVDAKAIIKLSNEDIFIPNVGNKKIILTVGRISKEKGQYTALQSLKLLVESGIKDLEWWFVGDGTDMVRCKSYVVHNKLEEYVRFFGAKLNPYPYMKNCDLYIQPSEHEGFCITLAEAKLFKMPIITTDFAGAHEQLSTYSEFKIVGLDSGQISNAIKSWKLTGRL